MIRIASEIPEQQGIVARLAGDEAHLLVSKDGAGRDTLMIRADGHIWTPHAMIVECHVFIGGASGEHGFEVIPVQRAENRLRVEGAVTTGKVKLQSVGSDDSIP